MYSFLIIKNYQLKQYGENASLKTRCIAIKATIPASMDTTSHGSNVSAFQNAGIFVMKGEDGPVLKVDPSAVLLKTEKPNKVLLLILQEQLELLLTASSMKTQTQFQVV